MEHNIRPGQKYRHKSVKDVVTPELPNVFTVVRRKTRWEGKVVALDTVELVQLGAPAGSEPTVWDRASFEENFELIEEPLSRGLADPD